MPDCGRADTLPSGGKVCYIMSQHSVGFGCTLQKLGCTVQPGCDEAAHATHIYLQNMPPGHLLLKVDFKKAFQTLRLDKMLESVT